MDGTQKHYRVATHNIHDRWSLQNGMQTSHPRNV